MLIALLLVSTLALAYANGANDNFKATATVYGAGVMGYDAARRLATVAQMAGSLASVLLADSLARTFSGKGLVPDAVVGDPAFLVSVGAGAAAAVLIATRLGLPISTTHALVGGLLGAGLAMSTEGVSWAALGGSYFLPLALSPLIALAAAAFLYPLASRGRRALGVRSNTCLCIGSSHEPVRMSSNGSIVLEKTGIAVHAGDLELCREIYSGRFLGASVQAIVDWLHRTSAFSLGFARGLNDTPKVLALLVAAGWSGLEPRLSLILIAVAMAVGGFLRARRVAETLAHRITSLSHGQGLLSNSLASGLVIGASLLGSPVSTTHVSTGSLLGIGFWNQGTDWAMVSKIVAAWVGTLPIAALLAGSVALLLA